MPCSRCVCGALVAATIACLPSTEADAHAWSVARSQEFEVWCVAPHDASSTLARCEALRARLSRQWLGDEFRAWQQRCVVVVHATVRGYEAAVGRAASGTLGTTTVTLERGRVTARRIDLDGRRADWLSAALPHELTHAVIAEAFATIDLPAWVDEGIATLSDPRHKQARHIADFAAALRNGHRISLAELLHVAPQNPPRDRQHFYGQSLSLVQFLVERSSEVEFIAFVHAAARDGYDRALRAHYGVQTVSELQAQWLRSVADVPPATGHQPPRLTLVGG